MDLGENRSRGEELGGMEGREAGVRMFCMREKSKQNKIKQNLL